MAIFTVEPFVCRDGTNAFVMREIAEPREYFWAAFATEEAARQSMAHSHAIETIAKGNEKWGPNSDSRVFNFVSDPAEVSPPTP